MALETRSLSEEDYHKGYLELLGQLTTVGDIDESAFKARLAEIQATPDYQVVVIEDTESGRVVGSGTVFVERKFIHACGKVGHIEDVVVSDAMRGKNLGRRIIEELLKRGQEAGCYKVILDCAEKNTGFYEKCGMEIKGVQMAKYFE